MRGTILSGVILGVALLGCKPQKDAKKISQKPKIHPVVDSVFTPTTDAFGQIIDSVYVEDHKVQRNESFYRILAKYDFSPQQIYSITQQAGDVIDLDGLKPGQKYRTYASSDSSLGLNKMIWQPNPVDYVVFNWDSDALEIYKASRPLNTKSAVVSGTIDNSLYEAIMKDDASPLLAYKMAEIFAWEIDFFGLRKGDSFHALYEQNFIDDHFYGIGDVKAAEFTYRGQTYRAYKFTHGDFNGYFNEKGESVQKALLKMPFKFSQRISSRFSNNRMHPILHRRMPHHGVDYAAPYGTPVLSVGDGRVQEARYGGASGNIVKVKHNGTYTTVYMHLKGFAHGIHSGAMVKQGQVIGYVGNTGRSTGSHLDYRIYKNGRAVNPLTIELPSSESVPDSLMPAFEKVKNSLDRRLHQKKDRQEMPPGIPAAKVAK